MSYFIRLTLAFSTILFVSCKQLQLSDNENKAVEEIVDLYGGTCTTSFGTHLSTTHGKKSVFEIEVSNSPFFNENTMWTEMYTSSFAYIFYTHTQNDPRRFDKVRSSIVYKEGTKIEFEYTLDSLKMVAAKMKYVTQIINMLKGKDYGKIDQLLIRDFIIADEERGKFFTFLKSSDSTFGTIESFTPIGFKFSRLQNGYQVLLISGNVKRSIKDTQFSVYIHPGKKDELYLIKYDY